MKETRKNKALSEAEKRRRAANVRYWAARAAVLMDSLTEDADRLADEMAKAYIRVSSGVTEAINRAKLNFADNFRLTEKEAKELLKNADYNKPVSEILKKAAETAKDPGIREKLRAQMSAPAYKYRIDRAQSIADQMRQVTESIAKNQTVEITDFLRTEAEKAYTATVKDLTDEYRLLEEIKQRTRGRMAEAAEQAKALDEEARRTLKEGGKLISEVETLNRKLNELSSGREVGMTFGQIPKSFIEETLKRNWSGEHFSKRVWENTDKLSEELKGILLEHITTGASEYHTGRLVAERFGVAGWKARRLIRTETTYITAAAKIESFKEAGIDEYEYMALIDARTSDICKELDGEVFKVSEAQAGVNLPPMHPFCRSSIGAHFGDIAENERIGELADKIEAKEENIGKGVDNYGSSGIMNNSNDSIYDIPLTDKTIEQVPYIELKGFSQEQNLALQEAQKDVLRAVKDLPLGTEAGAIYCVENGNFKRIGDIVVGEYGKRSVNLPSYNKPYIVVHNHPDGKTLSQDDVDRMLINPKNMGVVAIGNNASTYVMQATSSPEVFSYSQFIEQQVNNIKSGLSYNDFSKEIEKIWKEGKNYGFIYTCVQNDYS